VLLCVQLAAARAESKDNRSKYLEELTKHNADLVLLEAAEAHTSELEKQLQAAQVNSALPLLHMLQHLFSLLEMSLLLYFSCGTLLVLVHGRCARCWASCSNISWCWLRAKEGEQLQSRGHLPCHPSTRVHDTPSAAASKLLTLFYALPPYRTVQMHSTRSSALCSVRYACVSIGAAVLSLAL